MNYLNNLPFITDINNINPSENSTFFICPYKVNKHFNPFITFLLYKQTIHTQELCSFLYIHFNENKKKTIKDIQNILKNIDGEKKFHGAIQMNEHFYLFYECESTNKIEKYTAHSQFFWTTMYEIIHLQNIFNIPIHYSTFSFFYIFPECIQLKKNNKPMPFPHIIYTSKNINNIFSNYNPEHQYYSLCHETNIININNIIRCIIYCDNFSNIQNNTFKFKNINDLQIISE